MIRKHIKSQSDFSSHFWYFPGSLEALLFFNNEGMERNSSDVKEVERKMYYKIGECNKLYS